MGFRIGNQSIAELADAFDPLLNQALDGVDIKSARKAWDLFKRWFYRHLVSRHDLSQRKGRISADYRYTLAMALVKPESDTRIGDAVYCSQSSRMGTTMSAKRSARQPDEFCRKCIRAQRGRRRRTARRPWYRRFDSLRRCLESGLGLRNQNPAPALDALLDGGRVLKTDDLYSFLANPKWNESTCDDRSLALLWPYEIEGEHNELECQTNSKNTDNIAI